MVRAEKKIEKKKIFIFFILLYKFTLKTFLCVFAFGYPRMPPRGLKWAGGEMSQPAEKRKREQASVASDVSPGM